jgi:DNA-directed RNA polymerase sigma subunit (sigma70/sigma32)
MPDKTSVADRSAPGEITPAFGRYTTDLLQLKEIMPEPDLLQDLIARELEFVVRAAMRIARWYPCPDLDILDLIQEGNLALLEAAEPVMHFGP